MLVTGAANAFCVIAFCHEADNAIFILQASTY